jgi:hypothetical protein
MPLSHGCDAVDPCITEGSQTADVWRTLGIMVLVLAPRLQPRLAAMYLYHGMECASRHHYVLNAVLWKLIIRPAQ